MNTKIVVLIGVAVVVLGGGYMLMQSSDTSGGDVANNTAQESLSEQNSGSGSFRSLMQRGENITCTFSSTAEGSVSNGTFYYGDGMYRVEAETETDGVTFVSNMIGLADKSYIWGGTPAGEMAVVIANDTTEMDESVHDFADTQQGSAVDLEAGVEYECDAWRPVPSMFVPPSDIEFLDMQAMMQNMPGMPEGFALPADMQTP